MIVESWNHRVAVDEHRDLRLGIKPRQFLRLDPSGAGVQLTSRVSCAIAFSNIAIRGLALYTLRGE